MYLIRQPKEKLDSGVWIINNKSENYFHWMTESLTRVLSFKEINQESVILLPELLNKYEFVSKTLDSLGAEYKFYNDDYIYNIKNLFLTSHTAPAGNYNSEIIRLLHSNLNKALSQPQKKRFWLSRKYSGRRILLNEELIIPILEKFNIEIFYPEKHSYSEQVDNYRKAEFIGGIHGAALTNMLYMEKNSNVLELRDANDYHNNCYYSLASSLENNFYYLLCTSDNDGNSTVNYDDLENLLEVIFRS
jgi:capsular polysaccharide biosynthesis protein